MPFADFLLYRDPPGSGLQLGVGQQQKQAWLLARHALLLVVHDAIEVNCGPLMVHALQHVGLLRCIETQDASHLPIALSLRL
jgi:hypothetical protein